jgi:sialate O-acetylesterase
MLLICLSLLSISNAFADVTLPRLLNDGAILQRDKPLTIWGWAADGEKVIVNFVGKEKSTQAADGKWQVTFPARKAGGCLSLMRLKGR